MATLQKRLEALTAKGYTVGVGAVDGDGQAISYRVAGHGLDTTIAVDNVDELLDDLEETHEDRAAEAKLTQEELDERAAAAARERQEQQEDLVGKIKTADLPTEAKDLLLEVVEVSLGPILER